MKCRESRAFHIINTHKNTERGEVTFCEKMVGMHEP